MLRDALLATPLLLVSCASPTSGLIVGDATGVATSAPSTEAPPVEAPAAPDASADVFTVPALEAEAPIGSSSVLSTVTQQPPRHHQRFTLKGGYYGSSEDGLDDGYIVVFSQMRFL